MPDTGLMQPQAEQTTQRNEILDAFRDALAPSGGLPLEDKLQALPQAQRDMLLSTAKMVRMAMAGKVATGDYTMGYADLVAQMYGRMDLAKRQLIIELLDETAPLEFVPQQPAPKRDEGAISFYNSPDMQSAERGTQKAAMVEQGQRNTIHAGVGLNEQSKPFLDKLTQSESSGDSNAEIIIADGRRYVGALQFGDARLQDYQAATDTSFTQDEFKANSALQDRVAAWHIADIDKTIDGLGLNTDGYDRDGLRSVAHLGGKGGMRKFVKSGGKHNPADELGTSLQDYYDKFSSKT